MPCVSLIAKPDLVTNCFAKIISRQHYELVSVESFQNYNLSGIPLECQTVWRQVMPCVSLIAISLIWLQTVLQR